MVSVFEVLVLDRELLERAGALLPVPAIGAEDAADVEEYVRD
jgi:hypothetical protein